MNYDEMLGREARSRLELHEQYVNLIRVLDMVAKGLVHPSRVKVDLETNSWEILPLITQYVPADEDKETPATEAA